MIYPCEQKYFQSQYGAYEAMLMRFRQRLRQERANNKLVVLGYSMSDEHIVEAILDAVQARASNLTVYALLGPESTVELQIARFRKLVDSGKGRINVMIGQSEFLGPGLERADWETIRGMDFWKFENLVRLLAGGT